MEKTTKQTPSDITKNISLRDTDNNNFQMYVHRSGNTGISLHDVSDVTIGEDRKINGANGVFVVRDLIISHDNGMKTEITLFIK